MKILVATLPAYGHLYPVMPLALAFREAGHSVRVATGPPFLNALPLETVPGIPAGWTLQYVEGETARRYPQAAGFEFPKAMFAEVTPEGVIAALGPQLAADPPDLVVAEGSNVGAVIAAQLAGVPVAVVGISQWSPFGEEVYPAALEAHRSRWESTGRPVPAGVAELFTAYVEPFPPGLRTSPGPLGVPLLSVRSTPWSDGDAALPAWLTTAGDRPRAYVTLGTVSYGAVEVIRAAIDDLADLDVDVLVAAGPAGDPAALGTVPERVRVERFVAQDRVLGLVDVAVHHGGTGTVLGALAHGVPQVLLPQGADHFHNAQLLHERGAARMIHNDGRRPGDIAAAVSALLNGGPEAAVTAQLAAEIAAAPAVSEVADALVGIVSGHPTTGDQLF